MPCSGFGQYYSVHCRYRDVPDIWYHRGAFGDKPSPQLVIYKCSMRNAEWDAVVPPESLHDYRAHVHEGVLVVEIGHTVWANHRVQFGMGGFEYGGVERECEKCALERGEGLKEKLPVSAGKLPR